jgi:ankyrin repeat protein
MGIISTAVGVLIILSIPGYGNRNESASCSEDSETAVLPVPAIDPHSAVVSDNLDMMRQHIEAGSDLNVLEPSRASTPLITAAALGRTEAARILIDAGAELNYRNGDGSTALHTAVVFGNSEIARMLINAGTDLNIQNNDGATALHTAAFLGRTDIVEVLLKKGADKSLKNKRGKTAYETVAGPFEEVKAVYDAIATVLKPFGVSLDYERIKAARPEIAAILK